LQDDCQIGADKAEAEIAALKAELVKYKDALEGVLPNRVCSCYASGPCARCAVGYDEVDAVLASGRTLSRDIIADMLQEMPPDEIVWTTSGGPWTAARLSEQVRIGSGIGRQYASDLLRVSRDFLSRQSQKATSEVRPDCGSHTCHDGKELPYHGSLCSRSPNCDGKGRLPGDKDT
jgi:hypothetical protein